MFETFRTRAQAVSAEVHRVAGSAAALDLVTRLLREAGVADAPRQGAVWADGPILAAADRAALARQVPGLSFSVTRESAEAARVGVTEMDYAVANTGTLAQASDAVEQRLASTLPTVHVALVRGDRLVPDLAALFRELGPSRSRFVTLVTGPSRTADIERVLTIGVHGPERLVVVVVDDQAERSA